MNHQIFAQKVGYRHFDLIHSPLMGGRLEARDIAVRSDGMIFSATPQGVAVYDGEHWDLVRTPETAESIAIGQSGEVYVGLRTDFGTLEVRDHELAYESLSDEFTWADLSPGKCTQVISFDDRIYFSCTTGIAVWPGTTETKPEFHSPADGRSILSLSLVRGEIIAGVSGRGYCRFSNGKFVPLVRNGNDTEFSSYLIGGCEFGDDAILLASYLDGYRILSDGHYQDFETDLSNQSSHLKVKGVCRAEENLYIATTQEGVFFFDGDGQVLDYVGPEHGAGIGFCMNHAVVGKRGDVWIPLAHGGPFARFDLTNPARRFDSGRQRTFWVRRFEDRTIASLGGRLVNLADAKGTASAESTAGEILEVGQSRSAVQIDDQLLVATSNGLVVLSDKQAESVSGVSSHLSSGAFLPKRNLAVFGSVNRLEVFRRDDRTWIHHGSVTGIPGRCYDAVLDEAQSCLWFTADSGSGRRHLYRLRLNDTELPGDAKQYLDHFGVTSEFGMDQQQIALWNSRLIFNSAEGLRQFDITSNAFVPFESPSDRFQFNAERIPVVLAVDSVGSLWIVTAKSEVVRFQPDGRADWPAGVDKNEVVSGILTSNTENAVWIATDGGELIRIPTDPGSEDQPIAVRIRKVRHGHKIYTAQELRDGPVLEMPFRSAPMTIEYTSTSSGRAPFMPYQYRLTGLSDSWSEWSDSASQEFRSLPPGTYRFEVRTRSRQYHLSPASRFPFRILAPWYQSRTAWLGYAVATAMLTVGIIRWRTWYVRHRVVHLEQVVSTRTRELRQSREKYRWLVEGLEESYVFFVMRQDGTLTYASPSAAQVLGADLSDVVGQKIQTFLAEPAPKKSFEEFIERSFRRYSKQVCEVSFRHSDGSHRYLELTQFAIPDVGYESERECIAKDITDLRKAQAELKAARDELEIRVEQRTRELSDLNEELRQEIAEHHRTEARLHASEEQFRSIVDDQNEMVVRFTADGQLTFANRAYRQRHGLTPDNLEGFNVFSVIHPDDRDDAIRAVTSTSGDRPVGKQLLRVIRKNGETDWAEWNGRAILDDDGGLVGYQAVGHTVTALMRAHQQLRESEMRYRSVVENQHELIIRFDADGIITFSNRVYAREYGGIPEEMVGLSCFAAVHPDDVDRVRRAINSISRTSPFTSVTMRVVRPDGSGAWREWNIRALYDDDDGFLGYQAIGRDITALQEARLRLDEKEQELAHLGRVTAMGEMVAGISHEINQPLATIANFSSASLLVLQNDEFTTAERQKITNWLERIADQTLRISRIIQHLRRFGRPSSQRERFHINDAVSEALFVTEVRTRHVLDRVIVDCPESLPQVWADRIRIEQVLVNLIRNACDALENCAERCVTIRARPISDGRAILVTVTDTGPGISQEILDRAFESFVTSKSRGMGLGLSISRSIIESHGGRIRAIADGGGGHIEFELPVGGDHDDHD